MDRMTVTDLNSYNSDDTGEANNRNGLTFMGFANGDPDKRVNVRLDTGDLAFLLSALVEVMGADNVRNAVEHIIAEQAANNGSNGLSMPSRLLKGLSAN